MSIWGHNGLDGFVRCPYKNTKTWAHRYTKGIKAWEDRCRGWTYAVTSQETARIFGNHQKLGRSKERFLPRTFRGSKALPTSWFWTSRLQNFKGINVAVVVNQFAVLCYGSCRNLITLLCEDDFQLCGYHAYESTEKLIFLVSNTNSPQSPLFNSTRLEMHWKSKIW
jgi:hypothetical protein